MLTNTIQSLLTREMDRKEFIITLGMLLFTVAGVAGFLESVKKVSGSSHKSSSGFGSGPYGG